MMLMACGLSKQSQEVRRYLPGPWWRYLHDRVLEVHDAEAGGSLVAFRCKPSRDLCGSLELVDSYNTTEYS